MRARRRESTRGRRRHNRGFNPRLARAGEATTHPDVLGHPDLVSIRASPVRARRQDILRQLYGLARRFNPRLARAGEATSDLEGLGYAFGFQSAPRPCGRGDGMTWIACIWTATVSIRASPVRARRHDARTVHSPSPVVSIRASPVRARRPNRVENIIRPGMVSIRASPVRARRRHPCASSTTKPWFQSAPRPCGRGDRAYGNAIVPQVAFQSAPRPCGRGDIDGCAGLVVMRMFQSAPRPCGRGDFRALERYFRERYVSIRASPVRARRHGERAGPGHVGHVSIRASPVRARRPSCMG